MKKIINWFKGDKKRVIFFFAIWFIFLMSIECTVSELNKPAEVSYKEFMSDLKGGKIDTVYYTSSNEKMRYTLLNKETRGMTKEERKEYHYKKGDWRITDYPAQEDFRKEMLECGVSLVIRDFEPYTVRLFSAFASLLVTILFITLLFACVNGAGLPNLNNNDLMSKSDIKFDDVVGHDEVISDLRFIVELLKNPDKGTKLGAEVPRGILFSGEPGTGKTLLAKAIAGESDVPFLYLNASNLIELYVGVGAKKVRKLFKLARKNAPCIIFIDELDAIGCKRGGTHGTSEDRQTLLALLQEMDGFKDRGDIFIIGATNNPEDLDSAIVRAGRFDRQIAINPPKDWKVRKSMFELYLKDCTLASDVDLELVAKQVIGFTGADIKALVNEAKLIAVMRDSSEINRDDLEQAIDKVLFKGNRSNDEGFKKDKQIVAYHESGHAVMSYLLGEPIARATIIGTTSGVGGAVMNLEKSTNFTTKKELEDRVCICYGGRCAERIKFNEETNGASNDITQATNILLTYVGQLGFDDKVGLLDCGVLANNGVLSKDSIMERISVKANELEKKTDDLLQNNFELVEKLANALLELETLSGNDVKEVLES